MENTPFTYIIKTKITALSFNQTIEYIEDWIDSGNKKKYVCICNTHSLVTASNDNKFNDVLEKASLCTPDGMPLVWAIRMFGYKNQNRVDGPNLMLKLCESSSIKNYKVFLYGSTNDKLDKLKEVLKKSYNNINIVGSYSPPFRPLTEMENSDVVKNINNSNADLIFVSLGCPKQEIFMYENRNKINGIMIGVGAAFDFVIGDIKRPPIFFQKIGLEWLFRLISEPKRLWKRYLYNNPMYIYKFIKTYRTNKNKQI